MARVAHIRLAFALNSPVQVEFQYVEAVALEQQLTERQMAEVRRSASTRATVTPDRFVDAHTWGDFAGEEKKWMERYFDAFVQVNRAGVRRLMFRVPAAAVAQHDLRVFAGSEGFSAWTRDRHLILDFSTETDDLPASDDGTRWMPALLGLRAALAAGDRRPLFLGWLARAFMREIADGKKVPACPPGLDRPTSAEKALLDFLAIPQALFKAARAGAGRSVGELPR